MEVISPVKDLLLKGWGFLQNFLAAIVIFVIGWIVAKIIKEIIELGHEIGYHYEDVSLKAKKRRTERGEGRA